MRRFLQRNIYWLLLVAALLALVIYFRPRPAHHGLPADVLFADQAQILKRTVNVHFENTLFPAAVAQLARQADCTIVIDSASPITGIKNLDQQRVTVRSPGPVPLQEALDMLLRVVPGSPGGIAVWETGGLVMIAPPHRVTADPQVTVVYDASSLLWDNDAAKQETKAHELLDLLAAEFRLEKWGGSGDFIWRFDNKLIIRTSPFTQREIAKLLNRLAP